MIFKTAVYCPILSCHNMFSASLTDTTECLCRSFGAQVLIDDNPRYALECAEDGMRVLLFDYDNTYPWCKTGVDQSHPLVTKVHNWQEVEQKLLSWVAPESWHSSLSDVIAAELCSADKISLSEERCCFPFNISIHKHVKGKVEYSISLFERMTIEHRLTAVCWVEGNQTQSRCPEMIQDLHSQSHAEDRILFQHVSFCGTVVYILPLLYAFVESNASYQLIWCTQSYELDPMSWVLAVTVAC